MSEYLEKLMGRARQGQFWDKPRPKRVEPNQKNSVTGDRFDKRAWNYITDQVPALGEQVSELAEKHPTSPEAYEDLFRLLNQGDPRFVDPEAMLENYRPQAALMRALHESEDLEYIRMKTRYDDYATAMAMLTMKDRMENNLDELQDLIDKIEAAMQALQEAMDAAAEAVASGEGVDEAAEGLAQAMKAAGAAQDAGDEKAEDLADSIARGLRKAKEELDRQEEQASAYGIQDGDLQRMSFEERNALKEQLDQSRVKDLANLIGQWSNYADAERRRSVRNAPAEIVDIETGNDLTKITASEVNNLAIPELEDLFWLRWVRHELMQKVVKGPDRAGKGPIIVICDESGSMGASLGDHSRDAWSKAVALALCDQARRQKRDFTYIGFSSGGQVWETKFLKGQTTVDGIVEFTEHFFGGGTSYEQPLTRAMEIVREYAKGGRTRPDIVFISDDECQVSAEFIEQWNKDRYEADVQCYGLQVGGGSGYKNCMGEIADRCISIDHLTASPEALKDLFRNI